MDIVKSINKLLKRVFESDTDNWFRGHLPIISAEETNGKIAYAIERGEPYMVARFGSVEIKPTLYFNRLEKMPLIKKMQLYAKGDIDDVFDEDSYLKYIGNIMRINAGFFPPEESALRKFSDIMLSSMKEMDLCGAWLNEYLLKEELSENVEFSKLENLEPYDYETPWSQALAGKDVLVIHPFADSIRSQYDRRREIWPGKEVLPEFNLLTLKAVQSICGNEVPFDDWFAALDYMKGQIDSFEYDVAIIGCGAYGFPLAAYAKQTGHVAIHLGGPLQILFGIKGKRWDAIPEVSQLYNDSWVRPSEQETPIAKEKVEEACYW